MEFIVFVIGLFLGVLGTCILAVQWTKFTKWILKSALDEKRQEVKDCLKVAKKDIEDIEDLIKGGFDE